MPGLLWAVCIVWLAVQMIQTSMEDRQKRFAYGVLGSIAYGIRAGIQMFSRRFQVSSTFQKVRVSCSHGDQARGQKAPVNRGSAQSISLQSE
jgi:hypothetical protein